MIKEIANDVNNCLYERKDHVRAVARAILSEQHVVLLGPPGVAKSLLITSFADRITDAKIFQKLVMKDTTPDEVVGPMSLAALEQDKIRRNTAGCLPEADFAFLDEIFKANSVVLNSTLKIMNERIFDNDGGQKQCPLITLMAASNEMPEDDELAALWDRFAVRLIVTGMKEDSNFFNYLKAKANPQSWKVPEFGSLDEIKAEIEAVKKVVIPDEVLEALTKIRRELAQEKITPSDRRYGWMLRILQAEAFLDDRNEVELDDMVSLVDSIWDTEDARPVVFRVLSSVSSPDYGKAVELYDEAAEVKNSIPADCDDNTKLLEATMKLKRAAKALKEIGAKTSSKKAKGLVDKSVPQIIGWNAEMLKRIGISM